MNGRSPFRGQGPGGFVGGLSGPVPSDLWVLLGVIFATFSLQFFSFSAWLPAVLRLTPAIWQRGFLWQLATYPYVGMGAPNFWFLLELLILFMFARDVLLRLGRRQFWRLLGITSTVAAVIAVLVGLVMQWIGGVQALGTAFFLMQGQRMVLTILIAAFATLNRNATILLFFVLPIQARWFLPLEIVFGFLGFLGTHDFAGFVGLCAAVAFTFGSLTGWRATGWWRETKLRTYQAWLKLRLQWMRKRRGLHIVEDKDSKKDPWLH